MWVGQGRVERGRQGRENVGERREVRQGKCLVQTICN
jgi:hypothetical protein